MLTFTHVVAYIVPLIFLAAIALLVFLNDRVSARSRYYVLLLSSMVLWLALLLITDTSKDYDTALFFSRLTLAESNLMGLAFLYFCVHFPVTLKSRGHLLKWGFVPAVLAFVLALTPYGIETVTIEQSGTSITNISWIYTFDTLVLLAYFIVGGVLLLRKRAKMPRVNKIQITLVLTGIVLSFATNLFTNYLFPLITGQESINAYGNLSLIVFSVLTAYAIVRHRLFDIRVAVARSLAYVFSLGLLLLGFSLITRVILDTNYLSQNSLLQDSLNVLVVGIIIFAFQPLKAFFDRVTNQIFYRDAYDPQEFLDQLNAVLVGNIELDQLVDGASDVIQKNLKSDFAAIGLNDKEQSIATNDALKLSVADARELRELLEQTGQKLVQADALPEGKSRLRKLLRKYNIALVYALLPNAQELQSVGYLVLGNKKSGNLYSRADQRLLEVVADELAITVQNALHFQEIKGFSATLQRKVDTATRELRRSNNKLKELDEAKDEFLSMASHQLRTPLTSVKGFISMVIDGDVGPISEQQRKVLEQAFESSQRMVFLIGDFLNVSRIKSGKFVIDKIPFDIIKLVHEEVNQLKDSAKARGLEFVYDPPAHMPEVLADRDKLRQVMMNFMDNALYYSPNGGKVTIRLYKDASGIVFKVTDTGIGVPKAEQEKLFTKFFRAENARQQRPDGTGIGLYMAKKVIVGHEGSLIFESVEGKGSTFGFRLPLKNNLK